MGVALFLHTYIVDGIIETTCPRGVQCPSFVTSMCPLNGAETGLKTSDHQQCVVSTLAAIFCGPLASQHGCCYKGKDGAAYLGDPAG